VGETTDLPLSHPPNDIAGSDIIKLKASHRMKSKIGRPTTGKQSYLMIFMRDLVALGIRWCQV